MELTKPTAHGSASHSSSPLFSAGAPALCALRFQRSSFPLVLFFLTALLVVPASGPGYNRLFNSIMIPSDDLCMSQMVKVMDSPVIQNAKTDASIQILCSYGQGSVARATGIKNTFFVGRLTWTNQAAHLDHLLDAIFETRTIKTPALLLVPPIATLNSSYSLNGYLSHHWLSQETALEDTAVPEIRAAARAAGGREIEGSNTLLYSFGDFSARSSLRGPR